MLNRHGYPLPWVQKSWDDEGMRTVVEAASGARLLRLGDYYNDGPLPRLCRRCA